MAKARAKESYTHQMIRTQEALQELLDSEEYHAYVTARDPRNQLAEWEILGDYRHDFLWIVLTNKKTDERAIHCVKSGVIDFPMKMRADGIDEMDAMLAEATATHMWEIHSQELRL